ncbi:pectinesterase 3-like [Eucalyptus grandis]|uniref:pectinesterase 3-like n=1 Tax=Eucalyptus grandis TaxID=71139 RepID=UPI00192EAE43|nr:pectinesterase 3-like [Eucalyptus grandis]
MAKDEYGDFVTISEAGSAIPKRKKERTVIHVKEGECVENVNLGADCWNVMMHGDGMRRIIVSASKSHAEGCWWEGIYSQRPWGFRNPAEPEKFQTLALLLSTDQMIFCRCYVDAYQDTLYTYLGQRFYHDFLVMETIDFIFKKAMPCSKPAPNLQHPIEIAPWQVNSMRFWSWEDYSTAILLQLEMGGIVNPMGWAEWTPDVDPRNTIFHAEYQKSGLVSGPTS